MFFQHCNLVVICAVVSVIKIMDEVVFMINVVPLSKKKINKQACLFFLGLCCVIQVDSLNFEASNITH